MGPTKGSMPLHGLPEELRRLTGLMCLLQYVNSLVVSPCVERCKDWLAVDLITYKATNAARVKATGPVYQPSLLLYWKPLLHWCSPILY